MTREQIQKFRELVQGIIDFDIFCPRRYVTLTGSEIDELLEILDKCLEKEEKE